jgi:small subunit ribosomal protein S3e
MLYAELSEFLRRELSNEGFAGVELRVVPKKTEILIKATKPALLLGEKGCRIRELASVIQKRFGFKEEQLELYAERVPNKGLSAVAQAEALKFKLIQGLPVRRAAYSIMRNVMEQNARGVEVIVSGKLRQQRANSMKFKDGYMIKTGQPAKEFVDKCIRHVFMKQGILGVNVKIMLPWDVTGKKGPVKSQPDVVTVFNPKEDLSIPSIAQTN